MVRSLLGYSLYTFPQVCSKIKVNRSLGLTVSAVSKIVKHYIVHCLLDRRKKTKKGKNKYMI